MGNTFYKDAYTQKRISLLSAICGLRALLRISFREEGRGNCLLWIRTGWCH